jgi:hypothetical protein
MRFILIILVKAVRNGGIFSFDNDVVIKIISQISTGNGGKQPVITCVQLCYFQSMAMQISVLTSK